jgi:hypothetical protein
MRRKLAVTAILVLAAPVIAAENPKFVATCTDVSTHGYRAGTDISGVPFEEPWSTDERFNATWTFQFDGGDQILIDGQRGHLLAQHPGVLILSDVPGSNGIGAGVWTFAIQLGMQKVVASQVNAYGSFDPPDRGVKARSTNLTCRFEFK